MKIYIIIAFMLIGLLPEYNNGQVGINVITKAYAQFYDYEDNGCNNCFNPLCTGNCYGPTSGCSACGSRDCNGSCMNTCSQCGRMGCSGSCTYKCGICGSSSCGGGCRPPSTSVCSCCNQKYCICRTCYDCWGRFLDGYTGLACPNACKGTKCSSCGSRHCGGH